MLDRYLDRRILLPGFAVLFAAGCPTTTTTLPDAALTGSGGLAADGGPGGSAGAAGQAGAGGRTGSGGKTATGGATGAGGAGGGAGAIGAGGGAGATGAGGAAGAIGAGGAAGAIGAGGAAGAAGASGAGGATGPEAFVPGVAPAAAKYFKKGINLGNRLEAPNEGDWGGTILASDFPFIAARGFDHVRIPIRFSGHALAGSPYTIDATFFARVDTVLDQAAAAGLAAIIDMHAYDELAANASGQKARFVALWTQIAARYKNRPDKVAFELLNEPYSQLDTAWNDIMASAIQAVRVTNPRRLLVVDTVYWADPSRLSSLVLPNDANILVAIHLYEPKLFTFQGQSWMGAEFMTTGVLFPGPPATPITPVAAAQSAAWAAQWFADYNSKPAATNPSGPATIATQIAYLTSYHTSQGRTVYNGEWGPQNKGDMASRVRLVTLVRQECEKAGVGWAIWEDRSNMNLFDSVAKTWVTQIVDALLPP